MQINVGPIAFLMVLATFLSSLLMGKEGVASGLGILIFFIFILYAVVNRGDCD